MDFDPDHIKWQCCCCHLASGLKILATTEVLISTIIIFITSFNFYQSIISNNTEEYDVIFDICLILTTLIMIIGSILLIYGITKIKVKFMYPTLFSRVMVIFFVAIFGVKHVVVQPEEVSKDVTMPPKLSDRKFHQEEPPMALRLIFLVFLMIFTTIGIIYTIYLIVRCINYIQAYAKLENRRASLIFVSQIDPELINGRRSSKSSNI